jgi:YgiT-type zinc finger domain-containing protein
MKYGSCCDCENFIESKVTDTIRVNGCQVELKNAPAKICRDCGEIHIEARFLLDLVEKTKAVKKNDVSYD